MRSAKKTIYQLLALLCLILSAVLLLMVRARLTPDTKAPQESAIVETQPSPTPCAHPAFEDGVCTNCGYACPHDWEDGVCALCLYACPHERHSGEDSVCTLCGSVVAHHMRAARCTRCGAAPVFTEEPLPESVTQPCAESGTVEEIDLGDYIPQENGRTLRMPALVYLPYCYDREDDMVRYNLVVALHGAYSDEHSMMDEQHLVKGVGQIRFQDIYDRLICERKVEPFIVVSLNTYQLTREESWTEAGSLRLARELRERVLPYMAEHYHTYAADATVESIEEARAHIGVIGLSNGALYALHAAMAENLPLFGGFACFSANYPETAQSVLQTLCDPAAEAYPVYCFFTGAGTKDFQQRNTETRFYEIVDGAECLSEGVNAFHVDVEGSHDWISWGAEVYNCLQVLFQEI